MNNSNEYLSKLKLSTITHNQIFKALSSRSKKCKNEYFTSYSYSLYSIKKIVKIKSSFIEKYNHNNIYFAIKATKKNFKKAVDRNFAKRRTRAILRFFLQIIQEKKQEDLDFQNMKFNNFMVIVPHPICINEKFEITKKNLIELLHKSYNYHN